MYSFVNALKNSYHNPVDSIVLIFKMLRILWGDLFYEKSKFNLNLLKDGLIF